MLAYLLLYVIEFAALAALALAAGEQSVLTKQEASTGFVNTAFLGLGLQHHIDSSNFFAYSIFAVAQKLIPGLFYGRWLKVALLAALPAVVYHFLRRRLGMSETAALPAAIAVGLSTGCLCLSWQGTEIGLETLFGFTALLLASSATPWKVALSGPLAIVAGGCYSPGLAFVPLVFIECALQARQPRFRPAALASLIGMGLAVLLPVLWWSNPQSLFHEGTPTLEGSLRRLNALYHELVFRTTSLYVFSGGVAMLGRVVGVLAFIGMFISIRERSLAMLRIWGVIVANLALYAVAAQTPGARRALPMIIAIAIFAAYGIGRLALIPRFELAALVAATLWLGADFDGLLQVRKGLRTSTIELPRDWEFTNLPGLTMPATVTALVKREASLPPDLKGYDPERTLAILYSLKGPVTREALIAAWKLHASRLKS